MFNLYQTVSVVKNGEMQKPTQVPLTDLRSTIHQYLDTTDIEEIDFVGHKTFITRFASELSEDLKVLKYSNRNVRILIDGEVFNQ